MKVNILELIEQEMLIGYNETNARAKVSHDLILTALSKSSINRNVTIKGGVVMRSITKNTRRATQDLDIDFIKYSLSNESIDKFISELNCLKTIAFIRNGNIEELNQNEYNGKRVFVKITDLYGNELISKIDIGVHNKIEIEQAEFCFRIALSEDSVNLLVNSNEQMIVEKLRSLLIFGPLSTRYKDIYDIYFLLNKVDNNKLILYLDAYIFQEIRMREVNIDSIISRLNMIFTNKAYISRLSTSDKKWIDEDNLVIFNRIISFFESLKSG